MYVPDSWGLGSCTLPWGLKCTLCLTTNFKDNCFNQCNCPDSTHLNPYVPCLDKHQLNSPEPFVRREPSIRSKKEKSKQIRKYMLTWNYIFKTCNRLIWVANKFNRDIQSQFVFNFRDFLWEPGIFYKGCCSYKTEGDTKIWYQQLLPCSAFPLSTSEPFCWHLHILQDSPQQMWNQKFNSNRYFVLTSTSSTM